MMIRYAASPIAHASHASQFAGYQMRYAASLIEREKSRQPDTEGFASHFRRAASDYDFASRGMIMISGVIHAGGR